MLSHVSFTTKIEVECRNLEEGFEAAEAGAQIIMFDNMLPKVSEVVLILGSVRFLYHST